jgi:hypothetical protein
MASVLSLTPLRRLDAAALSHAEVGALPDHLDAKLGAGDADRIIGAVADGVVGLRRCAHIGADAAEEQEIDRRHEDRLDHLLRRRLGAVEAEHRPRFRRQRDFLERAREHAAARGDERLVVVLPARARQLEQPLALGKRPLRIGRGIDEDVAVIEGCDELRGLLPQ